jgi:hypothetical protein
VPSAFVPRSLLTGVGVAAAPSPATEGAIEDLLGRLLGLGVYGVSALRLAIASAIWRLMISEVLSPAMMDSDEVRTGVQGRDGSLDFCVLSE